MGAPQDNIPKITPANTKKEMLDAYTQLVKKVKDQSMAELKPEKVKEDRQIRETVQAADTIASDSALKRLGDLKCAIDKELSDLAARLGEETDRYNRQKAAIEMKDRELQEIFEIERNAYTLAALLESQKHKKLDFEENMAARTRQLEEDIRKTRAQWEREKQQYLESLKEQKREEEKSRKREKEDYEYNFNRERALQKAKLSDELEVLEKEIKKKQADFDQTVADTESGLQQREKTVADREKFIGDLEAKVASFPKELEAQIAQAVKSAVNAVKSESEKNEQLIKKGFEGDKNVLQTRIDALERTVAIQERQIEAVSKQLEKAYEKVQDIAVQAVSHSQTVASGNQRKIQAAESENT